jgi:leucyl-tRNA synthetase
MQRKWIGRSEGCEIEMKVITPPSIPPLLGEGEEILSPGRGKMSEGQIGVIRIYTTRIDTVFGMTYAVIAPDHEKVQDFITPEQLASCEAYILSAKNKSDLDRTGTKEKT